MLRKTLYVIAIQETQVKAESSLTVSLIAAIAAVVVSIALVGEGYAPAAAALELTICTATYGRRSCSFLEEK